MPQLKPIVLRTKKERDLWTKVYDHRIFERGDPPEVARRFASEYIRQLRDATDTQDRPEGRIYWLLGAARDELVRLEQHMERPQPATRELLPRLEIALGERPAHAAAAEELEAALTSVGGFIQDPDEPTTMNITHLTTLVEHAEASRAEGE